MYRVIDYTTIYNKSEERIMYCIKTKMNSGEHPLKSQLIVIYDLDHDGILRVGFPGNPFTNNMFFKRTNEVVFYKENNNEIIDRDDDVVYTTYYNAFNKLEDVPETNEDIIVVSMDTSNQVVNSIHNLKDIRAK